MRKGLMDRNQYPLFAGDIGHFLAHTLYYTSDLGMNQQEKKLQQGRFINPELCKITEDLIFDDPYRDAETNNFEEHLRDVVEAIWQDNGLLLEVAQLREKFLTRSEALLHGDLHTGSIFIRPDSTKVIDPEFAYYGPMGFDIGAVLANLLLNFAAQEGWSPDPAERTEYRSYLLNSVKDVWNHFEKEFRSLWSRHSSDRMFRTTGYQDLYMLRLLQDTFGFAGAKMVRRVIGLAHVADIDKIEDAAARERAQRLALAIGTELIRTGRQASDIDEMIQSAEAALQILSVQR
jgi:5-methylthioribose kinase